MVQEVVSLKCPNCGAAVHGEGRLTCAYCGSALEIVTGKGTAEPAAEASDRPPPTDAPPEGAIDFGVRAFPPMAEPRFDGVPDLAVTAATVEIPFDPKVYYNTGEVVAEARKEDARGVLAQLRVIQAAVNRGDVDLYLTAVGKRHPALVANIRRSLANEFAAHKTKRHGRVVNYQLLDRDMAWVNVTSEEFVFDAGGGPPRHRLVTVAYTFRKEANAWKLEHSTLARRGQKTIAMLLGFAIIIGIAAGVAALIWAVVKIVNG